MPLHELKVPLVKSRQKWRSFVHTLCDNGPVREGDDDDDDNDDDDEDDDDDDDDDEMIRYFTSSPPQHSKL